MPRLIIEWTSAGEAQANEALAEEIVERAVLVLDALAPIVHGDLAFDPYAAA
jgi:hypothetical protein